MISHRIEGPSRADTVGQTPRRPRALRRLLLAAAALSTTANAGPPEQPEIGARSKPVITVDGLRFHDLSGDGALTPYEDWRLAPDDRARDLLARMTLREKAGLMMHGTPPTADGSFRGDWDVEGMRAPIEQAQIRFFIHRMTGEAGRMAQLNNAAQEIAEGTRLGIPLTFSSDTRNTLREVNGVSVAPAGFTRWPEAMGLAAIGDLDLIRSLSDIARREYRAIGIRMALSPQADLFTEPRWFRGNASFGDDAATVSPMVAAFIEGYQGSRDGLQPDGVATVVKHWIGYGAQVDGLDSHNPYGKEMALTETTLAEHVRAFEGAFEVRAAAVMPTYSVPAPGLTIDGQPVEPVAVGFNRQLLEGLLRDRYGFAGAVISDWLITSDCAADCLAGTFDTSRLGMPWGVEHLSGPERFAKAIAAGEDQFGGVMDTDVVVGIVEEGLVTEERIDQSVLRLLTIVFQLGLFENAYLDPANSRAAVGAPESLVLGMAAQQRSMVLLENRAALLPLAHSRGMKAWLHGVEPSAAREKGFVPVDDLAKAQVALIRIAAPFTSHPAYFFGASAHEGPLAITPDSQDYRIIAQAKAAGVPVVVNVYLDRPAVLSAIRPMADVLLGDFGVTDAAFLDIVTGRAAPEGRLPVELPASDQAVEQQRPDLPSDTERPLYARGYGLRFTR
ncbi:glycoside hydrolase family 3 protein [Croceibacterium ferulae]|uniref:glycoside hydrolase family 3 protein n=1 Tax=Croceibacterium ferulae TaxID=1854641 RepID=UPI000EAD6A3A|nr:glycoside hydrolase family 3 N-terminal domain-containing protein [Croceibacterium ferulae]